MTPPTTPPIRAALLDDLLPAPSGVVVVEAARALLVVSAVVSDMVDVVVGENVGAISELVENEVGSLAPLLVGFGSSGGVLDIDVVD